LLIYIRPKVIDKINKIISNDVNIFKLYSKEGISACDQKYKTLQIDWINSKTIVDVTNVNIDVDIKSLLFLLIKKI
jgi:hypothetical protein